MYFYNDKIPVITFALGATIGYIIGRHQPPPNYRGRFITNPIFVQSNQ